MPKRLAYSCLALAALVAHLAPGAAPLQGQSDTVTVVPGPHYAARGLTARILGRDYRDLWTAAIDVPVLDLGAFAGGLTPVQRGSGKQTISLRFRGGDGREYNFRSVDKDQTGGLHPDFQETLVDRIAQDQVHSKHPSAALVADSILDAAGVLHPEPHLYLMPDDPRLGEFRAEFAGMLGMLEVHPNEGEEGTPNFAGAARIAGTERLLEHLEEGPDDRVDARAYLRARLVDLLLGDWDRHMDQWRWARFDRDGVHWWVPVPEDRDNAFSNYEGLLMGVARRVSPSLVAFDEEYPDLVGLTWNAQILDRRLLAELPAAAVDSVAADLERRLSDAVIEAAVAQSPPEHRRLRGEELTRKLRARRDALPEVARRFYAQLSREVDVRATDEPEVAEIERLPDGALDVRLYAAPDGARAVAPYFHRRFLPGETREVRVFLHGGDDRAVVRGHAAGRPLVRLVGGGGDDVLVDSAGAALYDDRGENRFLTRRGSVVDRREFAAPEAGVGGFNDNAPPYRDWGSINVWLHPVADWRHDVGPVVGVGPSYTRFGFRRAPHARKVSLTALYAPLHTRFGVELSADVRRTNSPSRFTLLAQATQLELTRFHGFGNDTPGEGPSSRYEVWETRYRVAPLYHRGVGEALELFAGPVLQYTRPDLEPGGPADQLRPLGSEPFGQVGALAGATLDTRDLPSFPRRGVHTLLQGAAYPGVWDAPGAFGSVDARAATYLPLPLPLETTLAARAGGRMAWGDFPFPEAAFLGGGGSLRGFPWQRFAGDAALFGGAELRTFLTRVNFISRADLGVIALADAGRVFVDDDSPGGWHAAAGGGVWVGILDRSRTFSLVAARGETTSFHFSFGMPF